MSQPVFKFCIHRTVDDAEVYAEIADLQLELLETAHAAYLALPPWEKLIPRYASRRIAETLAAGLDRAIERLRDRTVRL